MYDISISKATRAKRREIPEDEFLTLLVETEYSLPRHVAIREDDDFFFFYLALVLSITTDGDAPKVP